MAAVVDHTAGEKVESAPVSQSHLALSQSDCARVHILLGRSGCSLHHNILGRVQRTPSGELI